MPDWDYKALTFFLSILNTVAIIVTVIYAHLMNKQKANAESIEQANKDHRALCTRVVKVEKAMEYIPTHNDVTNLNHRIGELAQAVKKMEGTMGQVEKTVVRVNDYLLNKG